jgi:antitoxin YefM
VLRNEVTRYPQQAAVIVVPMMRGELCTDRHFAVVPSLDARANDANRGLPGRGHLVILMTMSSTLPLAEVKAHLSELVSRVNAEHDRVTVTVHGRPSAMLLAVEDVEALEETIAILSDAETMKQLIEAEAEIARGEGETQEQLAEAMRRRRGSA